MRNHYAVYGDVIDEAISNKISERFSKKNLIFDKFESIFTFNDDDLKKASLDFISDGYHICPFRLNTNQVSLVLESFRERFVPSRT